MVLFYSLRTRAVSLRSNGMNIEKIQLEPDEHVLLQVRKHWFVLFVQIVSMVLGALIPLILYVVYVMSPLSEKIPITLNLGMLITFYAGWLLIVWMALFNIWNNYYLDVWTITNKRLIAVDQKGFFSRTTASFRLDRLQDTSIAVKGIIATLLDFGTLEMQTAGEERNFKATGLPHPGDLKALILNAADALNQNGSNTAQHKDGT